MNYIDLIVNIVLIPVVLKVWNEVEDRKKRTAKIVKKQGETVTYTYTRKQQRKQQEQKSCLSSKGFKVAETEKSDLWKEI